MSSSLRSGANEAEARLMKRRLRAERRFRFLGKAAIGISLAALAGMLIGIVSTGASAFIQPEVQLEVYFDSEVLDPAGARDAAVLARADYQKLVRTSLREIFPSVSERRERRRLNRLVSNGAGFELRGLVAADPSLIGRRMNVAVPLSADAGSYVKGDASRELAEGDRRLKEDQLDWLDELDRRGMISSRFNTRFFSSGDSREPELAGILGAFVGSVLTLLVTIGLSFPIGVATALYLEEFARKSRMADFIEVNINNLAAVPSIVFGLLGLGVFISIFGMPRSSALVGGVVLALLTLPTIIIASRAAMRAVPPSIREAALGMGASPLQVVLHHVLPLALPGILTGTIIGMARALGETAPLLMIGMVAFIVDVPSGFVDPSTVLPVQIFLWADSPERAFVEKTSAAIMILLAFLMAMNLAAVLLRRRFERRW